MRAEDKIYAKVMKKKKCDKEYKFEKWIVFSQSERISHKQMRVEGEARSRLGSRTSFYWQRKLLKDLRRDTAWSKKL